jgi:hypothetical protein
MEKEVHVFFSSTPYCQEASAIARSGKCDKKKSPYLQKGDIFWECEKLWSRSFSIKGEDAMRVSTAGLTWAQKPHAAS